MKMANTVFKKEAFVIAAILVFSIFTFGCQTKTEEKQDIVPINEDVPESEIVRKVDFFYITSPDRVMHSTYSIVIQRGWEEIEYNNSFVYIPPEGNFSDPFSEKFAVSVEMPISESASLKKLTEADIRKTGELLPNLKVINQSEDEKLGQMDAIKVVFTGSIENRILRITQYRAIQGNRLYVLTQQCEYEKCMYDNIFKEVSESFSWRNP